MMYGSADTGHDVELLGKSGRRYNGKIYSEKNSTSSLGGKAIACLSNSSQNDSGWTHQVNAVYNTENIPGELAHFQSRDDISHLILIPYSNEFETGDKVDDLIRSYIHR
jgi:hypothetical protein